MYLFRHILLLYVVRRSLGRLKDVVIQRFFVEELRIWAAETPEASLHAATMERRLELTKSLSELLRPR